MTTYKRVCIRDYLLVDSSGQVASVTRGTEYLTSDVHIDGRVTVFGTFWWRCPVDHFAGEVQFT